MPAGGLRRIRSDGPDVLESRRRCDASATTASYTSYTSCGVASASSLSLPISFYGERGSVVRGCDERSRSESRAPSDCRAPRPEVVAANSKGPN